MIRVRDVLSRHPGLAEVVLLAEMPCSSTGPAIASTHDRQTPDSFRVACTSELRAELAEAIGENHFKFHAQPIRKAGAGRSVGR